MGWRLGGETGVKTRSRAAGTISARQNAAASHRHLSVSATTLLVSPGQHPACLSGHKFIEGIPRSFKPSQVASADHLTLHSACQAGTKFPPNITADCCSRLFSCAKPSREAIDCSIGRELGASMALVAACPGYHVATAKFCLDTSACAAACAETRSAGACQQPVADKAETAEVLCCSA